MRGKVKMESSVSIQCPKCGENIPITETLNNQLTERAREEIKRQLVDEQKALTAKEKELQTRETKLAQAEQDIDDRVATKLSSQRSKLVKEAEEKALEKARENESLELRDLKTDAAEKAKKLKALEANELQLRKEKRELEAAKENLELDVTRKIDGERESIRQEALKAASEQHRLKDAEKDKKLNDALRINEELNRKLQQGPQQIQGEVLELELEAALRKYCPSDEIAPVPKGVHGANVLQTVHTKSGTSCGTIIWEAKHTKKFDDGWIPKLKDDRLQAGANIAVLVTSVLPKEFEYFGSKDDVWITTPKYIPNLIAALRMILEEQEQARRTVANKSERVEALFNYFTGPDFTNRVKASMEVFIALQEDFDKEKRAIQRLWAKREERLQRCQGYLTGMYGSLQGLLGASMEPIAVLELADGEQEEKGLTIAAQAGGSL